jgi:hypothetical protein
VVKVEWSYLPFAWGTSFRNGGLPFNKNILGIIRPVVSTQALT